MTEPRLSDLYFDTILFDFGGTLDADGIAWKDRFHAHCVAAGLAMSTEAFALAFYAADDPMVGALPFDAGLTVTVRTLSANLKNEIVRRGGANAGVVGTREWEERLAAGFLTESYQTFARNRPILEALSGRYRLGIVSNFYGNLETVCEEAGLAPFFGAIVDSHRVGAEKPDPAIFHAAFDRLDARPETTLFVGDSLKRDREGASRTGISFAWIASPEARGCVTPPGPGPLEHPVFVSIEELAGALP